MVQVVTVDDREKTPNFGKPMFNAATVFSAPELKVYGFRAYSIKRGVQFAIGDVFAAELEDAERERISFSKSGKEGSASLSDSLKKIDDSLKDVQSFSALVGVVPSEAGLGIDMPQVQEVGVVGSDPKSQFEYLKGVLGKVVKASEILKAGSYVDTIAITKGKGFEGVITRFGVKRKQHKSRKTVREVGVISPWHPATVMYTVPRAGQMGFHQRIDKNKRVLAISNAQQNPITPGGGFPHFGDVRGDYLILRGSVPGPIKRLVDLRLPLYPRKQKVIAPRIIEIQVGGRSMQMVATTPAK
jgi:large subunit ribosomal protein L3